MLKSFVQDRLSPARQARPTSGQARQQQHHRLSPAFAVPRQDGDQGAALVGEQLTGAESDGLHGVERMHLGCPRLVADDVRGPVAATGRGQQSTRFLRREARQLQQGRKPRDQLRRLGLSRPGFARKRRQGSWPPLDGVHQQQDGGKPIERYGVGVGIRSVELLPVGVARGDDKAAQHGGIGGQESRKVVWTGRVAGLGWERERQGSAVEMDGGGVERPLRGGKRQGGSGLPAGAAQA